MSSHSHLRGELIALLNADLGREMQHMMFYLKNASTIRGPQRPEICELFLKEAASEMKHVQEFQDLIIGLTGSETIHVCPAAVKTFADPRQAVAEAYRMECEVVHFYVERIRLAEQLATVEGQDGVDGKFVQVFLEEQLLHSQTDANNLKLIAGL